LRSHDERFDATINKMDLGADVSSKIEVIAVTESLPEKAKTENKGSNIGHNPYDDEDAVRESPTPYAANPQMPLVFDEFQKAIYAKIVKKCGTRSYWADWANDIAKIAQTHITRITGILDDKHGEARKAFDEFLNEIRDDLNESITEADAIEMLAQHVITKPVFDALFEGYSFAQSNPVSQAMQSILAVLDTHNLEKESESLEKFYNSVKVRAAGIDNIEGKQKIIVELYDKFFRNAFPRMTEKLSIVYTPVEVVDFIIHSINDALQNEFGETLGSKNVHILDPFTGTGTFITRLLQSGLIRKDELAYKYKNEIHANEIVLLAYYIAAINIEQVYHDLSGEYAPFEGICLTDTFQLYEKEDLVSNLLADNSSRREKQKKLDIRVIMGNPPYSAGQTSANDNNANVAYPKLDESIRSTYAEYSTATNKNALYDSYIRAIRWASDRLGNSGVMGFVSNASFIDSNTSDGLRKCLAEEFSSIYLFHLRGNQRTSGELSRQEGGKIFGSGSRAPIAISVLIKNPDAESHGNIYLHDIGDYLSREEKLASITTSKSINGITHANGWQTITPDEHHDWVNQQDDSFDGFIKMGDKKDKTAIVLFETYSNGIKTNSDAYCYNSSLTQVKQSMKNLINFYNDEVDRFHQNQSETKFETFVKKDDSVINWHSGIVPKAKAGHKGNYNDKTLIRSVYRPFFKEWLYYDRMFNQRVALMPSIFPDKTVENQVICVTGRGSTKEFCAFISNTLPDLEMISKGQCFPLKLYELAEETTKAENTQSDLFATQQNPTEGKYTVKDGITDAGLAHFQQAYPDETISKEAIFYYIYGLLHSEDYKTRYADNLTKELPRIPCVKQAHDFWAFSQAGRDLAELHINYETVKPYDVAFEGGKLFMDDYTDADYRVEKMKFAKTGKVTDKTTVIYNHKITLTSIPLEAYEYIVNGKPALEWVMERQAVTTDKKSGITNDANDWAIETMGNAKYPLELFQRVITVSLETMKIVKALPRLDI
ncbi:MAG: type ISP restriction/modification enzyme, partial [bacterium]